MEPRQGQGQVEETPAKAPLRMQMYDYVQRHPAAHILEMAAPKTMKYVVWGAPGGGKTSIARHVGISDRFHDDESLAEVVFGNRIDWYAGPTLAELLGVPERVAA